MLVFFGEHVHEGFVVTIAFLQGHVSFAFTVHEASTVGINKAAADALVRENA